MILSGREAGGTEKTVSQAWGLKLDLGSTWHGEQVQYVFLLLSDRSLFFDGQ
jgi:hypothetical protein